MNLRPSDKEVLAALAQHPEGLTPSELVAALPEGRNEATARHARARLLAAGLITVSGVGRSAKFKRAKSGPKAGEPGRPVRPLGPDGGVGGAPKSSTPSESKFGSLVGLGLNNEPTTNLPEAAREAGQAGGPVRPDETAARVALMLAQADLLRAQAEEIRARSRNLLSTCAGGTTQPGKPVATGFVTCRPLATEPVLPNVPALTPLPTHPSNMAKDIQPLPQSGSLGESIDRLKALLRRNRERSEMEIEATLGQALSYPEEQVRRSVASVELREARGKDHEDAGAYAMKLIRTAQTFEAGAIGDWREIDKRIEEARKGPKKTFGKATQRPEDDPNYVAPEVRAQLKAKQDEYERQIRMAVEAASLGARK